MGRITITLVSCILLCLFTSCHSNAIYFDLDRQVVVGCGAGILRLQITSEDDREQFSFSVLPGKKGSREFSVKKINKDYYIEDSFIQDYADRIFRPRMNVQNFQLRPNTEYVITNHSNGDATRAELGIRTGGNGAVVSADKTSCK